MNTRGIRDDLHSYLGPKLTQLRLEHQRLCLGAISGRPGLELMHLCLSLPLTLTRLPFAASEIYYVISGALEVGVQEEASTGRFVLNNVTSGQNVIAPQGLPHYVQNNECTGASLLQFWNAADYGTVILYANLVNNFPDRALMGFTGLDQVRTTLCFRAC